MINVSRHLFCASSDSLAFTSVLALCMHTQLLNCVQLVASPLTSLPGSSVHGIFLARILALIAISSSRESSNPGIEPESPVSPDSLLLSHLQSPYISLEL